MKRADWSRWLLLLALLFLGAFLPPAAQARHRHGDFVIGLGWPGLFYPPSPYYYPPMVVVPPSEPPVYIERERPPSSGPPPENYWYYCAESRGYYPYVKECPGGWMQVVPQSQPKP